MVFTAAKVTVRLFHELRTLFEQSEIQLEAATLRDVLQSLISKKKAAEGLLFDSHGKLRGYTLYYVNNTVLNPPDLARKLNDGDLVLVIPPAAGG
jgi:molybdopterin converting factor small subunit